MENPYLESRGVAQERQALFWAAGQSPNRMALATRKVCQNDEFLDTFPALTSFWGSHICRKRGQWR
jgi:hypothetical protein